MPFERTIKIGERERESGSVTWINLNNLNLDCNYYMIQYVG